MNQTEGNNQYKTYQPELGALVNQFLTLITVTVQESVNHAAQNIFSELNLQKQRDDLSKGTDGFLTRVQIADLLKISYPTLHRYQCQGLVPVTRIGRKCLYNKVEVLEALKNAGKKKGRQTAKT